MNDQLLESLRTLSVAERIRLMKDLRESLESVVSNKPLSPERQSELDRRLDAIGQAPLSRQKPRWGMRRSDDFPAPKNDE